MTISKTIELMLRSVLFLILPAYILLNGLFYLVFGHLMTIEWTTIISYLILVGTIMYKRYKPISQEERLEDGAVLKNCLQSHRWETLQDNHSYAIIRPSFDAPLNLVVDDRVTIEKNGSDITVSGPQFYVTEIFKTLHNTEKDQSFAWFKPFRYAFIAVVLAMPLVRDSG
ncbi:MAG: hypothetical protein JJU01_08070, partial [Alkalibacterium sp.]|nr:hypothetical protein [Alkalibacterium sp.]